jgi:GAF domain-containing protein
MKGLLLMSTANLLQRENTRLLDENRALKNEVVSLRDFVRAVSDLYEVANHFQDDSQLYPLLSRVFKQAMHLCNAPDGSLSLLDDETNELVFIIVQGKLSEQMLNYRMPANEGIIGWVVQHREPALVRNAATDPRFSNRTDQTFMFNTQSILAVPLLGEGKIFGVVELLNQPGDVPFSDSDLALVTLLCRAAGQVLAFVDRLPNGSSKP